METEGEGEGKGWEGKGWCPDGKRSISSLFSISTFSYLPPTIKERRVLLYKYTLFQRPPPSSSQRGGRRQLALPSVFPLISFAERERRREEEAQRILRVFPDGCVDIFWTGRKIGERGKGRRE